MEQKILSKPTKTNWVLFIIIGILSFAILTLLTGSLSLSTTFFPLISLTTAYIFISIISLVIGLITAFILNKVAKSNKSFLLGGSIISFLSAIIISIVLSIQKNLAAQLAALESEGFGLELIGFKEIPNAFLTGILIIIFFNILFISLFFRKEQKAMKDLTIYLFGFVIFLILYLLVPLIIT